MIPKDLQSYYQLHSKFYDLTRWAFLFGRYEVMDFLPELPVDAHILDLGCGTGIHLSHLREKYPLAEITGLDLSADMLVKVDDRSIMLRNEDYSQSSFEPEAFDLILCSYSLSMMNEIDEKIENILYHLKSNGMLLIVDFHSTQSKWFSKWMKKNHVHFDNNLFNKLDGHFDIEFNKIKKGYFGLYTYMIFYGKNW